MNLRSLVSVPLVALNCVGAVAACTSAQPSTSTASPPVSPEAPHDDSPPAASSSSVPVASKICTNPKPPLAKQPVGAAATGFFGDHPLPSVVRKNGRVLANPRFVPVIFEGDPHGEHVVDLLQRVGCTSYWHAVIDEYGVGEATAAPPYVVKRPAAKTVHDADVVALLNDALDAQEGPIEAPGDDTIYVVVYPEGATVVDGAGGVGCKDHGGYHVNTKVGGREVAYAVVPRCKEFVGLKDEAVTTASVTHEIIEAAIDPFPMTKPAFLTTEPLSWSFVLGGEAADLCSSWPNAYFVPDDLPYTVSRSFSNAAARAGKRACVPVNDADDYYLAAPATPDIIDSLGEDAPGVKVAPGTSVEVPIELYDEQGKDSIEIAVVDYSEAIESHGTSKLELPQTKGKKGDKITLTITAAAASSAPELALIYARRPPSREYRTWPLLIGH